MTLTEFLLARIAEDEACAGDVCLAYGLGDYEPMRARVLAECEAKRRIVAQWRADAYTNEEGDVIGGQGPETHHETLCLLALPYADHSDYRDEWRP